MLEIIKELALKVWSVITTVLLSAFPVLNALIIIVAGCLGALLYGRMKQSTRDIVLRCLGLGTVLLSASELWDCFFVWTEGQVEIKGTMLVLISVLIGWLFGTAIDLDKAFFKLGLVMHRLFETTPAPDKGDSQKTAQPSADLLLRHQDSGNGFVMATVLCGYSSLIFTHFLNGRMDGDPIPLLIKLAIDAVLIFTLSVVFGSGVPFSSVTVLLSEGLLGVCYSIWGDHFTPELMDQTALIGAVILLICGLELCLGKRLRPANFIPALFIPAVYTLVVTKVTEKIEEKVK